MKILFTFCLSLITSFVFAQSKNDTLLFHYLFANQRVTGQIDSIDSRVFDVLTAVDQNLNQILRGYKSEIDTKFTVIYSPLIKVRKLVDKEKGIQKILADTSSYITKYWNENNRDTANFLFKQLIVGELELYYPSQQCPEELFVFSPIKIQKILGLKNILFYDNRFNKNIDSFSKKMNIVRKRRFYNFLYRNLDNFSKKEKKIRPESIEIDRITFSSGDLVYVGIDIYGSHLQLIFNSKNNWKLEGERELWVY